MRSVRASRCSRRALWTEFPSGTAECRTTGARFAAAMAVVVHVRRGMVRAGVLADPAVGRLARASLRRASRGSVDSVKRIR
jgi:hypothetical protein